MPALMALTLGTGTSRAEIRCRSAERHRVRKFYSPYDAGSLEKRLVGLVYSFADSRKCTPPCPMSRTGHEFCARRKAHFFFNSAVQFTTRLSGADASSVITESTTNRLPSRVTSYWFTPAAVRYIV